MAQTSLISRSRKYAENHPRSLFAQYFRFADDFIKTNEKRLGDLLDRDLEFREENKKLSAEINKNRKYQREFLDRSVAQAGEIDGLRARAQYSEERLNGCKVRLDQELKKHLNDRSILENELALRLSALEDLDRRLVDLQEENRQLNEVTTTLVVEKQELRDALERSSARVLFLESAREEDFKTIQKFKSELSVILSSADKQSRRTLVLAGTVMGLMVLAFACRCIL